MASKASWIPRPSNLPELTRRPSSVLSPYQSCPPELGVRYGAAVRSRLEGEYTVLPFIGRDIRKLKRERS